MDLRHLAIRRTCSPKRSSCPKTRPVQLADGELRIMRDMVRGQDFRHFSIRALALHAQRIGCVFAAPRDWTRQILRHGWPRPRFRLHPPKPTVGIRTTRPSMLETAGRHLVGVVPAVMADSGAENVNGQVNKLLDTGKLRRVLAQAAVSCSN